MSYRDEFYEKNIGLFELVRVGDDMAIKNLFEKYFPIVRSMQKKYYLRGLDYDDYRQEGMISFVSSVQSYDNERSISFGSYFRMNLDRKFCSLLRKQCAQKRRLDIASVSIDEMSEIYGDACYIAEDLVTYHSFGDIFQRERLNTFHEELSYFEKKVFEHYLDGVSTANISNNLECGSVKVKSAIDRIRRKLRAHMAV